MVLSNHAEIVFKTIDMLHKVEVSVNKVGFLAVNVYDEASSLDEACTSLPSSLLASIAH